MFYFFIFCELFFPLLSCLTQNLLFFYFPFVLLNFRSVFIYFRCFLFFLFNSISFLVFLLPLSFTCFYPPPPSPPILWYFLTLQCIRLLRATTWHYQRILKKSYTNGVISMWNPFTNAFPLASQSYSLNVKVVIYVPPFVSIFSTLLHGCCCFY